MDFIWIVTITDVTGMDQHHQIVCLVPQPCLQRAPMQTDSPASRQIGVKATSAVCCGNQEPEILPRWGAATGATSVV